MGGRQLLELINGILDLSKIEAGKMTTSPERFDVETLIGEIVDTVAALVQERNNTLTVNCDEVGVMFADRMKTRQILMNLLGNAAKFTRNGWISVDVRRLTIRGRETIQFSVADTGVGMSRQQAERIFDAFTQADVTTTREYGGTGRGLAIVSRFCELMGGSVSVESHPGEGSTFFVHLPAEAAAGEADIVSDGGGDDFAESPVLSRTA
jgi:signal transduction histidine kinase